MGRPPKDPASVVNVRVQPPAEISERMAALWAREFDRFPPGYYVSADVNAMLVYLHTVSEYDAAMARAAAATKPSAAGAARSEVRAIRKQLVTLQRALRMFPTTRSAPDRMNLLADKPPTPEPVTNGEEEPAWRAIMRTTGGGGKSVQ